MKLKLFKYNPEERALATLRTRRIKVVSTADGNNPKEIKKEI